MIFEVRFYSRTYPRPVTVTLRAATYREARQRARGLLACAFQTRHGKALWEIGAMIVLPE